MKNSLKLALVAFAVSFAAVSCSETEKAADAVVDTAAAAVDSTTATVAEVVDSTKATVSEVVDSTKATVKDAVK